MPHQSKVVGKSNLRVLSLSGTSYLGQGLSWPPFCWARTRGLPRALGGPTGIRGRNACDGRPPALLPLATWPAPSPPNPGGKKKRLPYSARCSATPDRPPRRFGHPAQAHLRALLSEPHSPRRAVAPPRLGPAELPGLRSAPPAQAPPAPEPDRAAPGRWSRGRRAEAGLAVTRRGARVGRGRVRGDPPGRGPHACARSCRDPRGSSPTWILPAFTLHYLRDARHAARDLALISALLPAHPLSPYSVPHKPRRKCAFFLPLGWIMSLKGNDQKCPSTNRILKLPGTGGPSQPWAAGVSLWTLTFPVASAPELELCADWKAKPSQETSVPAESCLPPDSAVALEHPGFAELCKGTLLSVIFSPLILDYQIDRGPLFTF